MSRRKIGNSFVIRVVGAIPPPQRAPAKCPHSCASTPSTAPAAIPSSTERSAAAERFVAAYHASAAAQNESAASAIALSRSASRETRVWSPLFVASALFSNSLASAV
jgi:hypothetical protein